MEKYFNTCLDNHNYIFKNIVSLKKEIFEISMSLVHIIKNSGKILICGNGGSAADSQHMAAELVGRFEKERLPISAIALTTDTSIITSISNDYDYRKIFSRQISAIGNKQDALICLSTSGNSESILDALKVSKTIGMKNFGLLGNDGGKCKNLCDKYLIIPNENTARIQEAHIFLSHIICGLIEQNLFEQ